MGASVFTCRVASVVSAIYCDPGIQIGPSIGHPCAQLNVRWTSAGAALPFKESLADPDVTRGTFGVENLFRQGCFSSFPHD
jgi:hypothetical protein